MINQFRKNLEQLKGRRKQIESKIQENKTNIKLYKREKEDSEKAQVIIQKVAKETQDEIIIHISDIVTLALNSIFDEPYEFKLDFVPKRGKTEADIYFLKEGKKIDPMKSSGGGAVDIASIALRIALWSLSNRNNTIILDEPMKFLSKNYLEKAIDMIKMLSEKLKIQFLIVSHIEELVEKADKVFYLLIKKGITKIRNRYV
jgi:DNA repair exonuclease SbcCD ATPase subunit